MKKSVLFIIGIIAILSVFIVTFFGTKANLDKFKVYINEVQITNYDEIINGKKYINLDWDEKTGEVSIFLDKKVLPADATEKSKVEFKFLSDRVYQDGDNWVFYKVNKLTQEKETIAVLHSKMGSITFYQTGSAIVQLSSKDGSEKKDTVTIKCKKPISQ